MSCRGRSSSEASAAAAAGLSISHSSFLLLLLLSSLLRPSAALVQLHSRSLSFTFLDASASFAAPVPGSGVCGALHIADPIDACSPIRSNRTAVEVAAGSPRSDFVLIVRGVCDFENKVRIAQDAGYQAAIIYDDREKGSLYSMMGDSAGIHIHAVFVSKMAGDTLKKFSHGEEGECCIGSPDKTAGRVFIISSLSLFVVISVIAALLFFRNCWLLWNGAHKRPSSINRQAVEVLPCFTFKASHENSKHMAETCAICLEDYRDGETLRVLPCLHDFHTVCVDSWLTKWGTFCPVCKHEMSSGK